MKGFNLRALGGKERIELYPDSHSQNLRGGTQNPSRYMMTRMGGMIEWSKSHNLSIECSKLVLIASGKRIICFLFF